jgi:UV DNA damage endonuclease
MLFKGILEMKIGYPCINRTIGCKGNKTFRLKSYSEEKLIQTVENNLTCIEKMIQYNIEKTLLFFRLSSELIPFASHPICTFNWQDYFKKRLKRIGTILINNNIRISMHPDQFIVLNSKNPVIVRRSIAELQYHADILDLMNLPLTAKIQLHIGGAYNDKKRSIARFIQRYRNLNDSIKKRLVIENDDKIYGVKECKYVSKKTQIPVLFDYFHHTLLNDNESLTYCFTTCFQTWKIEDGIPMVDYSSKYPKIKSGKHAETIDEKDFRQFLEQSKHHNFDIMLEIKDKEKSAKKAVRILKNDTRFVINRGL